MRAARTTLGSESRRGFPGRRAGRVERPSRITSAEVNAGILGIVTTLSPSTEALRPEQGARAPLPEPSRGSSR
jgi:hypothetical protein